jgi:hypothetical protein
VTVVYAITWIKKTGAFSFIDILALIPLALLCSIVFSIFPILIYIIFKRKETYDPQAKRTRNIHIVFIFYGGCLLLYCLMYIFNGISAFNIAMPATAMFKNIAIVFFGGTIISYLPNLYYILIKVAQNRPHLIRIKFVFIVFCICFVAFSLVYTFQLVVGGNNTKTSALGVSSDVRS